jgi:hypothetical protein
LRLSIAQYDMNILVNVWFVFFMVVSLNAACCFFSPYTSIHPLCLKISLCESYRRLKFQD